MKLTATYFELLVSYTKWYLGIEQHLLSVTFNIKGEMQTGGSSNIRYIYIYIYTVYSYMYTSCNVKNTCWMPKYSSVLVHQQTQNIFCLICVYFPTKIWLQVNIEWSLMMMLVFLFNRFTAYFPTRNMWTIHFVASMIYIKKTITLNKPCCRLHAVIE